jgi:alpha-D-xyloside xylohydrolase
MKPANDTLFDLLDFDEPDATQDQLWLAGPPDSLATEDGTVRLVLPFTRHQAGKDFRPEVSGSPDATPRHSLWVRAYGGALLRLTIDFSGASLPADADNPMLELHSSLQPEPLRAAATSTGWQLLDPAGKVRLELDTAPAPRRPWSDLIPAPPPTLHATLFPDGNTPVALAADDTFFPKQRDSFGLAYAERVGSPLKAAFSFQAGPNEKFAGTGERFAPLNLAGRTLVLENTDALGVNNRRAYKNVPFYLSSRPYGLLALTSAHVRFSLADLSTRAAQGAVAEGRLDLFVIGGGSLEQILFNYRRLTGFPRDVPLWSYGIWMGRMTYLSADQTRQVATRLRAEGFPCDVIHVDTGWFEKDWVCEWKFSRRNFPQPEAYLAEMLAQGFRVSLWQLPSVSRQTELYAEALANGYIAARGRGGLSGSHFAGEDTPEPSAAEGAPPAGTIDFTNPAAVAWYQGLLANLLRMGVAAIKTDFGESIDMQAQYHGLPAEKLHNLYALLYQKAAFEVTEREKGQGLIWARAGWVGCQRYPVHWGGDAACSWDGMAASLRGGLHLGLSGFAFWSHDVPGFHGVPDFMNTWPSDELYLRWTQMGVFTSHMRYHGAQPREPYEYPNIAEAARKWWRLRYALIPYLAQSGRQAVASGYPLLGALVLRHADDPLCWSIDDQFYCGASLLVAPVFNAAGRRDVYLPAGRWRDLWTGELLTGPIWLKGLTLPLERLPVYAVAGARIPIYPLPLAHTGEMHPAQVTELVFDGGYTGLADSPLGKVSGLR